MPTHVADTLSAQRGTTFGVTDSAPLLVAESERPWDTTRHHHLRHSEAAAFQTNGGAHRTGEHLMENESRFASSIRPTQAMVATVCELLVSVGYPKGVENVIDKLDGFGMEVYESHFVSLIEACKNSDPPDIMRAERGLWELVRRGLNPYCVRQVFTQTVGTSRASLVFNSLSQAGFGGRAWPTRKHDDQVDRNCRQSIGEIHSSEVPAFANNVDRNYVGTRNAWTAMHALAQPTPGDFHPPMLNATSVDANVSLAASSDGIRARHPHAQRPQPLVARRVLATFPSELSGSSFAMDKNFPRRQSQRFGRISPVRLPEPR